MKCELCNNAVKETFLKKLLGTFVKDEKGKKHLICQNCQRQFPDKKAILAKL
jgi:ribosomal protein S26